MLASAIVAAMFYRFWAGGDVTTVRATLESDAIPYDHADGPIATLVRAGHQVAICEQTKAGNQA